MRRQTPPSECTSQEDGHNSILDLDADGEEDVRDWYKLEEEVVQEKSGKNRKIRVIQRG